jgi:signal transduction histidine kinase
MGRRTFGRTLALVTPRWRPFASVRSRILGWSVLLLTAALAASTVAMHVFLVRQFDGRVNAELAHEIAEFRALEAQLGGAADGGSDGAAANSVIALLRTRASQAMLERDTVLIGLAGGRIVALSANTSPAAIGAGRVLLAKWSAVTAPTAGTVRLAAGPARYLAVPARAAGTPGRGVFVAAVLTGQGQAGITRMTQLQAEVGAIALLLGSVLAWFAAGRVLRPVRETTDLARRITDTDISGRISSRGRGEISELARTLNRMLDRLEAALTAQRRFLADAGHELRTPITIIQGNLDTLAVTGDEDAKTLAIVSDELTRMTRLVDELTLLASSERPDFLRPQPTDLAELTASLAAKARALDVLDERRFVLTSAAAGIAVLDPQRITQAVMQLVRNAVAHTPAGTVIEIGSVIAGSHVEFLVADHGPGIAPQFRKRVFERFARLDAPRTSGTGLGLSIVAAICAAHDGSVRLTEPPGGGAAFCLSVPLWRSQSDSAGPDLPPARLVTIGAL